MQSCGRAARRSACVAWNAYCPTNALRSTFATTSRRRQDQDQEPRQAPQNRRPHNPGGSKKRRDPTRPERAATNDHSLRWIDETLAYERDGARRPGVRSINHAKKSGPARSPDGRSTYFSTSTDWQMSIARLRDQVSALDTIEGQKKLAGLSDEQKDVLAQSLDYTPTAIRTLESNATPRMPIPWALTDAERGRAMRGNDILSLEIQRFGQYMTPTPAETAARQAIVDELKAFIALVIMRRKPGKTACELFGSEKTGLAMPLSDIDVRIYDISGPPDIPRRMHNRMKILYDAIVASDKYIIPTMRNSGRYPIINCQHRESGLDIQIVASTDTTSQQEITTKYLATIPYLRALFYVVRTMFAMRGLLDVYNGGLGSYGSFVFLLAALNRRVGARGHRSDSAAVQLRRFFSLYSPTTMDPRKHGIAVSPRVKFLKHDRDTLYQKYSDLARKRGDLVRAGQWTMCQRRPLQPWLLTLQDPADPQNDLGKRTNAIKHILKTMEWFRFQMGKRLKCIEVFQRNGLDYSEDEDILVLFVGRCHEIYHVPRERLREYGERVLKEQRILKEQGTLGGRQQREEMKESDTMKTAEGLAAE